MDSLSRNNWAMPLFERFIISPKNDIHPLLKLGHVRHLDFNTNQVFVYWNTKETIKGENIIGNTINASTS